MVWQHIRTPRPRGGQPGPYKGLKKASLIPYQSLIKALMRPSMSTPGPLHDLNIYTKPYNNRQFCITVRKSSITVRKKASNARKIPMFVLLANGTQHNAH